MPPEITIRLYADSDASPVRELFVTVNRIAGYRLVREAVADQASNKTIGGGIRRFHFEKVF